jgi:DNA-binding transcriptional MerR regulator
MATPDAPRADSHFYSITELSQELGVTPRAIRFYEAKGLLEPQRAGSTRVYTYRERARLQIILRGKRLGFSLALIHKYLELYDADPTHRLQLEQLLRGARQRLAELEAQRQDLELTIEELREIEELTLEALGRLDAEVKTPPTSRKLTTHATTRKTPRAKSGRRGSTP